VTAVIMIFVIPAFKQVFTSFGADLPAPDPGWSSLIPPPAVNSVNK
jgi:type II secretory pathway component PulF